MATEAEAEPREKAGGRVCEETERREVTELQLMCQNSIHVVFFKALKEV